MIDEVGARRIAQQLLDSLSDTRPLMLGPTAREYCGWWVVPFNSVEFYETQDFARAMIGRGPIVVSSADGAARFLGSGAPADQQIDEMLTHGGTGPSEQVGGPDDRPR